MTATDQTNATALDPLFFVCQVTAAVGGTVRVTVVNKTMPDYDLVFGPAIHDRGFIVHNVTAALPCGTTTATSNDDASVDADADATASRSMAVRVAAADGVPGYAGCEDPATGGRDVCNAIVFQDDPSPDVPPHHHWLLSIGINPPLPPAQPAE